MDFFDSNITSQVFALSMPKLRHLEVKKCRENFKLNNPAENSTTNKFDSLETIDIEECGLNEVPKQLLAKAPNLKRLSLAGNKITVLKKEDFSSIKMVKLK